MPDRKLDQMIKFLHRNNGRLSKTKRVFFAELEDQELQRIEQEYQLIFTANQTLDVNGGNAGGKSTKGFL